MDIVNRGAAGGEPSGGLDKVETGLNGKLTCLDLLIICEETRFENDLDDVAFRCRP